MILSAFILAATCGPVNVALAGGVPTTACVYRYAGDVQLLEPGATSWLTLKSAVPLKEGTRLKTGPGASCEILAVDGTFINLYENSDAAIETLKLGADTRDYGFNFIKGRILWLAAKIKRKASRFEIRTPSVVCAVRGTDFHITVSSAASDIGLFEGELDVKSNGNKTVLIAGSEALAGPGAAVRVRQRFSAVMEAEKRRYLKLKAHAESLRKDLAARDGFIDEYLGNRQKKLQDLESRRREKLNKLK